MLRHFKTMVCTVYINRPSPPRNTLRFQYPSADLSKRHSDYFGNFLKRLFASAYIPEIIERFRYGDTPGTLQIWRHPWHTVDLATPLAHCRYGDTPGTLQIWRHPWHTVDLATPLAHCRYGDTPGTLQIWRHPWHTVYLATPLIAKTWKV